MKKALFWKLLERFGVQGVQFILQIVLARLLDPEHYGMLSLMIIFTSLANVFIQNGFNTALIQNKDVADADYSSVFWVSLAIAAIMYGLIFVSAPLIGAFYEMPGIVLPLRVLALMLFPGALNSVQLAKVSKEMDFKKVFYSNVVGIIVAGVVGIIIALIGGGLWALVAQTMINVTTACIVMLFKVQWKPRLVCDKKRIVILFRFGWKLLVSSLIDTLYQDIHSLVVGKKYDSETLGYYNRGKQFPQFIISAINGAIQSVMLPAMSAEQDNKPRVKEMMRSSMTMSAYILFPMMAGLAAVAPPLVCLLLTDKWLSCVPYMQVYCFTLAFLPVHTCNLQAINALGRSDLFLKLEIIKKTYGIAVLAIAVFCFDSPLAIAVTSLITSLIGWFVNAYPNRKLLGYAFFEQLMDLLLPILMSIAMYMVVSAMNRWQINLMLLLIVQVVSGMLLYVTLSVVIKPTPYKVVVHQLMSRRRYHDED